MKKWIVNIANIKKGTLKIEEKSYSFEISDTHATSTLTPIVKNVFAFTIPILFVLDVIAMYIKNLRGGDATALVGGTAVFILIVLTILNEGENSLSKITSHLMEGLQFDFKVFSPVIPIAAFFYLDDSGIMSVFGNVLPKASQGIVNDLEIALANTVPINATLGAEHLALLVQ